MRHSQVKVKKRRKNTLILEPVLALPLWDMVFHNLMYLWFEGKGTKDRQLLWIPSPK